MHKTQKRKANKKSVQRHTGIVCTIIKKRLVQQPGWHNLHYAHGGPLLLAVIPGGRVQEDKNLAGFLFAVGSILFFPNCRNFRRADEDAFLLSMAALEIAYRHKIATEQCLVIDNSYSMPRVLHFGVFH